MAKKNKLLGLSLFGSLALITSSIITPIILTSCGNSASEEDIINYNPSKEAEVLISKELFTKINDKCNKYVENINRSLSHSSATYIKKSYFKLSILTLEQNSLKLKYSLITEYQNFNKIPADIFPNGTSINNVSSFIESSSICIDINLQNKIVNISYPIIKTINNYKYNPILEKPTINKKLQDDSLNCFLTALEYSGNINIFNNLINILDIINKLPINKQNEIWNLVGKLLKIKPTFKNFSIDHADLLDVSIENNVNGVISSFTFSYNLFSNSISLAGELEYGFYKYSNQSTWTLNYHLRYYKNVEDKNITNIQDYKVNNFFKSILVNSKILPIENFLTSFNITNFYNKVKSAAKQVDFNNWSYSDLNSNQTFKQAVKNAFKISTNPQIDQNITISKANNSDPNNAYFEFTVANTDISNILPNNTNNENVILSNSGILVKNLVLNIPSITFNVNAFYDAVKKQANSIIATDWTNEALNNNQFKSSIKNIFKNTTTPHINNDITITKTNNSDPNNASFEFTIKDIIDPKAKLTIVNGTNNNVILNNTSIIVNGLKLKTKPPILETILFDTNAFYNEVKIAANKITLKDWSVEFLSNNKFKEQVQTAFKNAINSQTDKNITIINVNADNPNDASITFTIEGINHPKTELTILEDQKNEHVILNDNSITINGLILQ